MQRHNLFSALRAGAGSLPSLLLPGLLLAAAMNVALAAQPAPELGATLTVSTEAAGPRIEPAIYGHFVEHLGTGVYGGLWVGPDSPIANTRGWRNDVVQALRRVRIPVIRWPGGCFADDYDWRDGIGPRAQRPVRLNKVWGGVAEPNAVGTHEFMDLVEQLGADAYLAGNMGSMPPRAMSQWLEYLTSASPDSTLTNERRRNGRDQPWAVKYFGVGNESWGCGGHMRPEYAADLHRQYATFMHAPVVRVASGDGEGRDEVTEVMMARAKDHMDALSLHYYTVPGSWQKKGQATGFDAARWALTMKTALRIEDRIVATAAIMDRHDPQRRVGLYVDEWGLWHDPEPGSNPGFLQQQNTLRDALVAALSFNVFHRHTARVRMANIAQMVNVLQALVLTDGARMVLTPTYHVFDLYQVFQGATPLALQLASPPYREDDIELPAVHATAARDAAGRRHVALVNLHATQAVRVSTNLTGALQARVLTAQALDAHNDWARPNALVPRALALPAGKQPLVLELPAKSVTVVTLQAEPQAPRQP